MLICPDEASIFSLAGDRSRAHFGPNEPTNLPEFARKLTFSVAT